LNDFIKIKDRNNDKVKSINIKKSFSFFLIKVMVDFKISNEIINENVIGQLLFYKKELDNNQVKDLLMNGNQEIIDVNVSPRDILVLPEDRILCSNQQDSCLTMYDEKLKLIKRIDRINGDTFTPYGIALDEKNDHLFVVDQSKDQIIMTDLEFKKIKSVGGRGSSDYQFNFPYAICYNKNKLYTCDYGNQRIQIFKKDLQFVQSLKVDYGPSLINISNSLMFVQSGNSYNFYIYDLDTLNLRQKVYTAGLYSKISVIGQSFYRYNHKQKCFLFFDENGNFKEELAINNNLRGNKFIQEDGIIVELNGTMD
jgi:hypothetical protein